MVVAETVQATVQTGPKVPGHPLALPVRPPAPPLLPVPSLLKKKNYSFKKIIYFWLHWVLLLWWAFSSCSEQGPLFSCGVWASHCSGFSLKSMDSGTQALAAAHRGVSCPVACGIFPDQGSNPCPHFTGRWILNPWTTGKSPFSFLNEAEIGSGSLTAFCGLGIFA